MTHSRSSFYFIVIVNYSQLVQRQRMRYTAAIPLHSVTVYNRIAKIYEYVNLEILTKPGRSASNERDAELNDPVSNWRVNQSRSGIWMRSGK